ncbi:MAG: type II secretion system F family protein [Nanoarchaeota archaeon]|nr:type II secretion system F family protein [Nanoarchaeota archaeon]
MGREKKLVGELGFFLQKIGSVKTEPEQNELRKVIKSYENQIRILNSSIPLILDKISLAQKLPSNSKIINKKEKLVSVKYEISGNEELVGINRGDKNSYLKELHISEISLKNLTKKKVVDTHKFENKYKTPNLYVKLANKFFSDYSRGLLGKGKYRSLDISLKKGGFVFLTHSYLSAVFLTMFLSFFFAIFLAVFFFFFSLSSEPPFFLLVSLGQANLILRFFWVIWIIPVVPLLVYVLGIYYPSTEASTLAQQIDSELPFATIQMSAIAGADIEPSNIFRILALSKEYKHISLEAKKLMNQINLYGYNLVSALKNTAHSTPSKEWADLLNGISMTIRSGGDLAKFLGKRSESLLFGYKLKREKSTKVAETFMDIYISVVIAAPMMLMLLLVIMSVSNIGISLGIFSLTFIMVSVVSLVNLIFLAVLHINRGKF